jgi:endonuclease III
MERQWAPPLGAYPTQVVDLIIFHKLHLELPSASALKTFQNLKAAFVDWNEVRVSTFREIQDVFVGGQNTLALAIFIKELLEFVHRERQQMSLEFLMEENLGDIRRYLKQVRGLDTSTVNLILRVRKEHPVLPLNRSMEAVLHRLGLLRNAETRDKKERTLHELVEPGKAIAVHHFLLNHSQEYCPPEEEKVNCSHCCMRRMCAFYSASAVKRKRREGVKNSRSSQGRLGRYAARIRLRGKPDGAATA